MSMQSAHPESHRQIRVVEQSRIESHPDGHTTIHLPSNHVLGFRPTPDSGGEAAIHVATALDVLHKAEARAKTNGGLTREEQSQFNEAIALSAVNIASFERAVEKAERELYAPPKAELADLILDVEIRNDARSRRGSEARGAAFQAIHDNERVMLAILRSPLPIPYFSEVAATIWKGRVAEQQPERLAAIERQRQSVEWAQNILHVAGRFVKDLPHKRTDA